MPYEIKLEDGTILPLTPEESGFIEAVTRHNCRLTLEINRDRVLYFEKRITEMGRTIADTMIVVLNVDDDNGRVLADIFMPGHEEEWEGYRRLGQIPFARGLVGRSGIESGLEITSPEGAKRLAAISDRAAVLVADHGTIEIFSVAELENPITP